MAKRLLDMDLDDMRRYRSGRGVNLGSLDDDILVDCPLSADLDPQKTPKAVKSPFIKSSHLNQFPIQEAVHFITPTNSVNPVDVQQTTYYSADTEDGSGPLIDALAGRSLLRSEARTDATYLAEQRTSDYSDRFYISHGGRRTLQFSDVSSAEMIAHPTLLSDYSRDEEFELMEVQVNLESTLSLFFQLSERKQHELAMNLLEDQKFNRLLSKVFHTRS